MKKIKYCLPIIKKTKQEVLASIEKYHEIYQYFEIWLDYIHDLDETFIKNLVDTYDGRVLFLSRRKNLEEPHLSQQKRQAIIMQLHDRESYIDLDISQHEELQCIQDKKLKINLICSYHNYEETPKDFSNIITVMETCNPAIYKISTMCTSEHDALRLLQLQLFFKNQQKKHIILGMGEFGTITRVYGTLWGNEMIFAPVTKTESSAPGQLTKSEMEKIFDTLSSE